MIFLTLVALLVLIPNWSSARVFRVDINGDPDTTFQNLDTALATAASWTGSGHIIEIEDGAYSDYGLSVPVGKVAEIKAVGASVVFQAPSGSYQAVDFLDVSGTTDLKISGFTVKDYLTGLTGTDLTGIEVEDMIFENNGEDGFNPTGIPSYLDNGAAIRLKNCDDGLFNNIEVKDGERGIWLDANAGNDGSDGNTISSCIIHDLDQYAIGIYPHGDNNTVDNCQVYNCLDRGIQIGWSANAGNVVTNCTVYNCNNDGILNDSPTGTTISNNEVYGCAFTTATYSAPGTQAVHGGIYVNGAGVISDNVVYNNGDGAGNGDYGIYVTGTYFDIGGNCLYGHAGVQAYDGTGGNYWHGNYYGAYVSIPYNIDGGMGAQDWSPKTFNQSPYASVTTWEVFEVTHNTYTVDFKWAKPNCDPWDTLGLASYSFTVNYDPSKLELLSGSAGKGYYFDFLGPADGSTGATYAPIGSDPTAGTISFAAANYVMLGYGDGDLGWATFKVKDVGATSIWITSTYLDSLNNPITVSTTPLSLTLVDTQDPAMVSLTAPSVVSDNSSSCFDAALLKTLDVEAQASDNFNLRRIRYKFDNGATLTLVGGLSGTSGGTTTPITLNTTALTEGAHNLKIWAEDWAGNLSDTTVHPFSVDRTGPVVDAVALSDLDGCAPFPGYTDDAEVNVDVTNNDATAVKMALSVGMGFGTPVDFAADFNYTFAGAGTRTLYVKLYDAYGNCNAYNSGSIIVDLTAPNPTAPLLINGGADKTNSRNVTVKPTTYDVAGGAVEYIFSEDDEDWMDCHNAGWGNIQALAPSYLASFELSEGEGMKYIYFADRDSAGNVSAVIMDSIEFDETPPELTSFAIDGDCVAARNVTVNFTWDGSDDAKFIHVGLASGVYDSIINISAMDPNAASVVFRLPNVDGPHTLYAILEDDIGNQSTTEWSDGTILDRVNPTITAVTVRDLDYGSSNPPIHGNYSNDATVNLIITGLSSDVTELLISTTGAFAGEETVHPLSSVTDPLTYEYEYPSPTDCAVKYVYVKSRDCAARVSAAVSDDIFFDITNAPTIASFSITPNPTNVLGVTLNISASDDCAAVYRMQYYEDGYGPGSWVSYATTAAFTLQNIGDGTRTVYLLVSDRAGNVTGPFPATVVVDQTAPTGTVDVVSTNYVNPGWSNTPACNLTISYAGDPVKMWLWDGTTHTGEIDLATSYPWTFSSYPDPGYSYVTVWFKDAAGNWSAGFKDSIFITSVTPPAPPMGSATGVPGGSCKLSWGAATGGYKYYIRYNYSGEYPVYVNDPPHPALGEGHAVGWVEGLSYDFEGPHMDIYAFSIWTMDSAGNVSTLYNTDIVATNYILGDLENDGVVHFGADLGQLASTYYLTSGDPGFVPECDYGPTHNGSRIGLPRPDGLVEFDDLVVAAMNYAIHGDWQGKKSSTNDDAVPGSDKKIPAAEIEFIAEAPSQVAAGDQFTVTIRNNNSSSILAMNMTLNFDNDRFEVVSVTPGEMFTSNSKAFFFNKANAGEVRFDGATFGPEALFTRDEVARVIFRAKQNLPSVSFEEVSIDARDWENNPISCVFRTTFSGNAGILPAAFALFQNYPNPFNPTTTIKFALPTANEYRLEIFNIAGQKVASFSGYSEAGYVTINWNAENQASGIYFYKLNAGAFGATRKMALIK
jgi:hypothetical protein